MQIWFITAWLGCSDSRPTPLWRHPEVSLLDWICQLLIPLLMPMKRIVGMREPDRTARIVTLRDKIDATELKGHDKLFAGWRASVVEIARADGSTLLVHMHRPPPPTGGTAGPTEETSEKEGSEKLLPLVLWLHGGGFTIGGAQDSVGATYATEPNPSPKPDLNPHPHPHPPPSPSPLTAHRSPLTFRPNQVRDRAPRARPARRLGQRRVQVC